MSERESFDQCMITSAKDIFLWSNSISNFLIAHLLQYTNQRYTDTWKAIYCKNGGCYVYRFRYGLPHCVRIGFFALQLCIFLKMDNMHSIVISLAAAFQDTGKRTSKGTESYESYEKQSAKNFIEAVKTNPSLIKFIQRPLKIYESYFNQSNNSIEARIMRAARTLDMLVSNPLEKVRQDFIEDCCNIDLGDKIEDLLCYAERLIKETENICLAYKFKKLVDKINIFHLGNIKVII